MSNPFNSPDEARTYITSVIEAEAQQAGTPLDEFERKLLAMRGEDSIRASNSLTPMARKMMAGVQ